MFSQTVIIISSIANFFLGWLIYFSSNKKPLYKWYVALSSSTAIWLALNLLTGTLKSIWIFRGTYSLGAIIPMFAYIWYLRFRGSNILTRKYDIFISVLACVFCILPFINGLVVLEATEFFLGGIVGTLGPMYIFWAAYLFSFLFFLLFIVTRDYKHAVGLKKLQTRYIMIGFYGFALIPLTVSVILPFFNILHFTWLDSFGSVPLIIAIGYATARYRLMNIRVLLTRSILYTILVVLVAGFFSSSVFFTAKFFSDQSDNSKIIVYIITSIIIVSFLDKLKDAFGKLTDRIFYKDRIDYQKLSQQASTVVAKEIHLSKLSNSLADLLAVQLKVKDIFVLINEDQQWHLVASFKKRNEAINLTDSFIKLINDRHDLIIIEELVRSQGDLDPSTNYYKDLGVFIKEAENISVEMIVPIFDEKKSLDAVLIFTGKNSGDLYNQDDINFLNVLVPQIATAIEKSKLYEEVQELARELQAKVDARTKSLKERNKFLTAMQAVTNKISRTMDLKQINQFIANSIASEFGYVGGILSFLDEGGRMLNVGAITENEQSKKVFAILGQDPKNFIADMKMNQLLGVKTVLSGQMNISAKMSDFFSPPVEKAVIDQVQETLGVKTIVGLPIFSEDKIIGIVHFLLAVKEDKFTDLDRDTMIALADQVGIVSRNLRLYNNLQATNQDLQVANMRLRELDQAKSEFLSIASHQLRTPISALKGYLSMISDGDFGTVPPKIGKVVKDLFESAARLARLVNIFLNVSRIESGRLKIEKKPLQIGDMIESVIAELHNESDKKGVKLIYKKPKPVLPLVAADSDKLREVVLNLIDNSIKYTPKGQIEVSAMVENDNMHFKVQDTGIGIDPEEAKNLFRKFVRASGAAQIHTGGSGLGLFIAQKIIKEHGGQIWVESAGKEQGSIFQFVIPMLGGEPNKEEMQS